MKRWVKSTTALLSAIILFLLCGCSVETTADFGVSDSNVKVFLQHVMEENYVGAVSTYKETLIGNAKLEAEAETALINYMDSLKQGVFAGTYTQADIDIKSVTLQKVCSQTECAQEEYSVFCGTVQVALDSRASFLSGNSLFDSGNYADAIAAFEGVLPEDVDYATAVQKKEQAVENYRKGVLEESKAFVDEGKFTDAVALLKKAVTVLPKDSAIAAELNTCSKTHIAKIIADAKTTFSDYTKYSEALSIINSGLQQYPEDTTLVAERNYYNQFVPVNVYDLEPIRGSLFSIRTAEDIFGNSYSKCFLFSDGDEQATYYLNKSYNTLEFKIFGYSHEMNPRILNLTIYGDGKELYSNFKISAGSKIFSVKLDVTGIDELEIKGDHGFSILDEGYYITDMILQRTAK